MVTALNVVAFILGLDMPGSASGTMKFVGDVLR
jgi:hypothetical protein